VNRNALVRLVLVAFLVLAASLLLGSGARAVQPPPDLDASINLQIGYQLSPAINSVAHGTPLAGNLGWGFGISNGRSPNTVTTPEISVASAYDPSLFSENEAPIASFPVTLSQPELAPQSGFGLNLSSSLPASLQMGCDTARSLSPALVPPGGIQQTITFTLRCFDPNVFDVQGGLNLFAPCNNLDSLCAGPTSFTFVSFLRPQNLDQGEQWNDSTGDGNVNLGFDLANLVIGKQYSFSLVVQTPNPFTLSTVWAPAINVRENVRQSSTCSGCGAPTSSVTIPVPSLDGPTPASGAVTFSTGESHVWSLNITSQRAMNYSATDGGGLIYAGPASGVAGQQVTLSTGWNPGGNGPLDGTPVTFTLGSQSCTGASSDRQAACTITLSQPVGSYTLQLFTAGDVSVYPTSGSAPFSITGPTTADQCKNGGWKVFGIFKNQGDCVSYVATKGKNPPG
jgi:hypothetical protein